MPILIFTIAVFHASTNLKDPNSWCLYLWWYKFFFSPLATGKIRVGQTRKCIKETAAVAFRRVRSKLPYLKPSSFWVFINGGAVSNSSHHPTKHKREYSALGTKREILEKHTSNWEHMGVDFGLARADRTQTNYSRV